MTREQPLFSIVTPVYNTDPQMLEECIASVLDQSFSSWELLLVDDASTSPATSEVLDRASKIDTRIHVCRRIANGGIVAASNEGIVAATGSWLVLLDHDDALEPSALLELSAVIEREELVDYIYTNEFYLHPDGSAVEFRKPDWSPERLRCQMYTCHLSAIRLSLARKIGGFRPGFDGSQDHDFILRVTEQARKISHIRKPLYYWRVNPQSFSQSNSTKQQAIDSGRRAVQDHCERLGIRATVELGEAPGVYRLRRELTAYPRVSVIIPTRGSSAVVWGRETVPVIDCVRAIRQRSTYQNFEYVVVADSSTPTEVVDQMTRLLGKDLLVVSYSKPFNFSDKINVGATAATSDLLLLLNDDTLIINDDWFEPMIGILNQPDVGTVGNMLFFEDHRLQHGGHCFVSGNPTHIAFKEAVTDGGFASMYIVDREVSGNTGACLLVRRSTFFELGGLSLDFGNNYNDVDFALKVARSGLRSVWTSQSKMFHFESLSRDPTVTGSELGNLHDRWSVELHNERFHDPVEWNFNSLPPTEVRFNRRWRPRALNQF